MLLEDLGKEDTGQLSQHYAGVAFDVGQNLDEAGRNSMRNLAINSGIWNYVEPVTQIIKKT